MPITTPSILSFLWSVPHGMPTFYSSHHVCVGPGLLILGGASGFTLGASSVVFDDATGEPLSFDTAVGVTAAGGTTMLGMWHYPADSAVVIFGMRDSGTAANVRVYGFKVTYDLAGNLTAGPVATWSPNTAVPIVAVGHDDVDHHRLMAMDPVSCKTVEVDLSGGSVGTTSTPSLNSIFGGSLNQTQILLPLVGYGPQAAMLCSVYNSGSGATTAQTYLALYSGSNPPTSSLKTTSRMTGSSDWVVVGNTTGTVVHASFAFATADYLLVDPGGTFVSSPPPLAGYIWSIDGKSPHLNNGCIDSHNDENRDYLTSGANLRRRVRQWNPATGAEVYAWQYGTAAASNFPWTGRLVRRGEFWWNHNEPDFQVWGGDYPQLDGGWHIDRVHFA